MYKFDQKDMGRILGSLLQKGFEMPIIVVSVGADGAIFVGEYTMQDAQNAHCEMIAERVRGDMFALPINLLFVDSRGEAARVLIDASGLERILH